MSFLSIYEHSSSILQDKIYDGRVFTEEYFINKYGEGLPDMAYILLTDRANQIHYKNECLKKIKSHNYFITRQKRLMNAVLKEMNSLELDNE